MDCFNYGIFSVCPMVATKQSSLVESQTVGKKKKASIAYQLGKPLIYRDRQAQSGKETMA